MAATVTPAPAPAPAPVASRDADALITQAGEQRSARVESLRAVAALSVMIAHVVVFSLASAGGVLGSSLAERVIIGGGNGVYLFFTLSGYLLFLPFLRHQLEGRPVDLARYARNRALRILPLYATVVVVLFLVAPAGAHVDWWRFALFIESFSPDALHRVDFPIWSVVVEVHFYLLLPLIAWVIARLGGRSPWRTAAIVAGIGIGSWALRSTRVIDADAPDIFGAWGGRYALPTLMYLFTSGMLLAIARLGWERRTPGWAGRPLVGASSAWIAAGVAVQLLICWDLDLREPFIALATFLAVAGCVLPLRPGVLTRALESRALALVGIASFSLYLWHWPVLAELGGVRVAAATGVAADATGGPPSFATLLAVGVPVCLAVAFISYAIVERPFLRLRRRWGATA